MTILRMVFRCVSIDGDVLRKGFIRVILGLLVPILSAFALSNSYGADIKVSSSLLMVVMLYSSLETNSLFRAPYDGYLRYPVLDRGYYSL